jgi:uncharacterized protein (TIGR02270 family)
MPTLLLDLLAEHLEEFQFLWTLREQALWSPLYKPAKLAELEERVEAHVEGLLLGGEHLPPLVREHLAADDPVEAFCAAYVLLRTNAVEAREEVLAAFVKAKGGQLIGIRQALCHTPVAPVLQRLRQLLSAPPAPLPIDVTAAVAEVLGFHGRLELRTQQMDSFLKHADAPVRLSGWRAAQFTMPRSPDTYQAGLRDPDPRVRRQALLAAVWARQEWLLGHCRRFVAFAAPEHAEELLLLAILGKLTDLQNVLSVGMSAKLGPRRLQVLGAFGHPSVMEIVLAGLESKDPLTAVAAGAAFTKMTGVDIDSGPRVALPPADDSKPDEFDQEFLDEVKLPDPSSARVHWAKVKGTFARGTRWCRGIDLGRGLTPEVLSQLDLESRREACWRGKLEGSWKGSPADLEAFPQKDRGPRTG